MGEAIETKIINAFSGQKGGKLRKQQTWNCDSWQDYGILVLEMSDEMIVDRIEFDNDRSAFVEVFVSKKLEEKRFQVLKPVRALMSPSDLKKRERHVKEQLEHHRIKSSRFLEDTKKSAWKYVKIVCSQPFNKTMPYGLSKLQIFAHKPKASPSEKKVLPLRKIEFSNIIDPLNNSKPEWKRLKDEDQKLRAEANETKEKTLALIKAANSEKELEKERIKAEKEREKAEKKTPIKRKKESEVVPRPSTSSIKKKTKVENGNEPSTSTGVHHKTETIRRPPLVLEGPSSILKHTPDKIPKITPKKSPKTKEDLKINTNNHVQSNKPMEGVIFSLSGYKNPRRSEIRDKALAMGAKYQADWDSRCTHLVCAFPNTPKYFQVQRQCGRIVSDQWIEECHDNRTLINWRNFMLGSYNGPATPQKDHKVDKKKTNNPPMSYDSDTIYDLSTDEDDD